MPPRRVGRRHKTSSHDPKGRPTSRWLKTVTVVTTLVDADLYSARDIAQLYRQRWGIVQQHAHRIAVRVGDGET